jgi:predicted DNA-binding transcriptional regulator AlpA
MNLLTVKQVSEKLSCSTSYIWLLLKRDPAFPKPISIGGGEERARGTRWVDGAIHEWVQSKHTTANDNNEVLTNENGRPGAEVHSDPREEVAA